jgi:hypothetical protein
VIASIVIPFQYGDSQALDDLQLTTDQVVLAEWFGEWGQKILRSCSNRDLAPTFLIGNGNSAYCHMPRKLLGQAR